jgi:hypothetical protein
MKLFIKISLLLLLPTFLHAQQHPYREEWNKEQADSLRLIWYNTSNETLRMAGQISFLKSLLSKFCQIKYSTIKILPFWFCLAHLSGTKK